MKFRSHLPRLAFISLVLVLGACATAIPTPYQPLQEQGGYSEQRLEANRYRVSFVGNSLTRREDVENYLLFRVAELTLSQGYDHFVLTNQDTEASTYYLQSLTSYDAFDPFYNRFWPRSAFAVGTATPITNYTAQCYVVMFKGGKTDSDINAYDAHEIVNSLGPLVRRPVAPGP